MNSTGELRRADKSCSAVWLGAIRRPKSANRGVPTCYWFVRPEDSNTVTLGPERSWVVEMDAGSGKVKATEFRCPSVQEMRRRYEASDKSWQGPWLRGEL